MDLEEEPTVLTNSKMDLITHIKKLLKPCRIPHYPYYWNCSSNHRNTSAKRDFHDINWRHLTNTLIKKHGEKL